MLLRFRLANHRSIRDEAELSFTNRKLRGVAAPGGQWSGATVRVAGIYGPNASGKSNLIHGLRFMVNAVRNSATSWMDRESFPHHPFAFDPECKEVASLYEIDFVVDGVRYTYGFQARSFIAEEWLYSYPTSRRRVLFERSAGESISFGRHLQGDNVRISKALTGSVLFLSLAAANKHPTLTRLQHGIVRHIRFAAVDDVDRQQRLRWVTGMLTDERKMKEAVALLRFADVGIASVKIEDLVVDDQSRLKLSKFFEAVRELSENIDFNLDKFFKEIERELKFVHGPSGEASSHALSISQESSGTIAWLALAVPALSSMRSGDVFVVDEVDASLHPRLSAALIDLFKDPDLNAQGGQLLFTSHDTSLLGNLHGDLMDSDEVWFVEKDAGGASSLYSLSEFSTRSRDNFERRYLQGRYGAIPLIAREELKNAVLGA